jgi:hypothetical protein
MAESVDLYSEVLKLRNDVDDIRRTQNAQVRFNEELKNAVVERFKGDPMMGLVFEAVDSKRSQKEIIEHLKSLDSKSHDAIAMHVSRKLNSLGELDLIETVGKNGGSNIYRHTNFSKVIRLTSLVKRMSKGNG